MNGKFVLRSGKYAGKTIEWLKSNQPSYLAWVEENQPKMLKEFKPKVKQSPPVDKKKVLPDYAESAMKPNTNFYNEPPDAQSLKYINQQKGINVGEVKKAIEKYKIIDKAIQEGKDIDPELTKNFVTFPINKPKTQDDEWNF